MSAIKAAFALGIIVLAAALFVPALIEATEEPATETLSLDNGTQSELTERLSVGVVGVNASATPSNATVEYTDETSFATNSTTVDVGNESTVTIDGDNLTTGVESVDGSTVQFNTTYPPMYGWNSGARLFFENSGLLLVALAGAMVVGLAAVAVKL